MKRALIAGLLAAAVAVLVAPAAASADNFSNNTEITIPDQGQASPYPSTIHVQGVKGPVVDVQVGLIGVTHSIPRDLDILLVPPDGHGVVLMSDVCGGAPVSNFTWLFRSTGNWPVMGATTCGGISYTNSNMPGEPDHWPNATGRGDYNLSNWHRKAMNGDWNLYVVDDHPGGSGKIARGWTLQLTTTPVDTFVPGLGTVGPAEHYPVINSVTGEDNQILTDLNVELPGLAHDRPSDLNVLLVGPQGQKVMLMSGACGGTTVDQSIKFDDQAPGPLPLDAGLGGCPDTAQPTSYPPSNVPPPAPPGPYGTSLSAFNGSPANGEWKLYAFDGADGADGYITERFVLSGAARPPATVEFAAGAVTLPEGGTQSVALKRSATGTLGPADVTVTTTAGSATAGADFTPLSQTVHFDRGEAEKTATLDAIDDGAAEPDESYSVKLSDPTGDAQLGAQSQVDVTIPASPGKSKPVPPPPTQRCDGKPATIVGSAGKDVLRGTAKPDVIVGLAGNDRIAAVKGNDTVCGGAGNDVLSGGTGRDRLLGGPGNDRLTGGAGRDTCLGGRGRNRVSCERKASK